MPEQPILDMLCFKGFPQKGIFLKIDHSKSQVFACTPVSVDPAQFVWAERRTRNCGPCFSFGAKRSNYFFSFCQQCHIHILSFSVGDRRNPVPAANFGLLGRPSCAGATQFSTPPLR